MPCMSRWIQLRLGRASSPSAKSGHHAGAHRGGDSAPAEHDPGAAACWGVCATAAVWLVANSDPQIGQWRLAQPARHRAKTNPYQSTEKKTLAHEALHREALEKHFGGKNTCLRLKRLPCDRKSDAGSKTRIPDSDVVFVRETNLSHDSLRRSRST